MRRNKMKEGFTILELIVVISVLLILIGIAIPRIKGMQDSGNISKAKAEEQSLQSAIESYFTNQSPHAYPLSTTTPCVGYFNSTSPLIISTPLYDPFAAAGTEYQLLVSSNGMYYAFGSIGAGPATALSPFTLSPTGLVTIATGNICITNGSGC